MSKEYLLTVENLSCERNYKLVFSNLSFKLEAGRITLIKGNNGSGKTSLLLCMAGILPYKGNIKIKKKYFDKIGYIGHKNALKETDTVREYLIFWKNIYNYEDNFNYIIDYFNFKRYLDSPIRLLSFGQKKKLSFSRLQMIKSKIWLLDEPISGLDKKTKLLILNLIVKHIDCGGGVIATSHETLRFYKLKNIMSVKID